MSTNPESMNPFSGTHAIVVEYDDIIRSPMLKVMEANKRNYKLESLVDLSPIEFTYPYGMFEWYRNRTNRNPLLCFDAVDEINDDIAFNVMKTFISSDERYTSETRLLPFHGALKIIIGQKFNMKFFVYNEFDNPYVKSDIQKLYPEVTFDILTGPFENAIKDVPADATWVLSDISKLNALDKTGKLAFANIMVAGDYRYNFTETNLETPIVDIVSLRDKAVFKLKMFMAAALTDEEKKHLEYLLRD